MAGLRRAVTRAMPVCRVGKHRATKSHFAAQDLPGVRARDGLAPPLGGLLERRAFCPTHAAAGTPGPGLRHQHRQVDVSLQNWRSTRHNPRMPESAHPRSRPHHGGGRHHHRPVPSPAPARGARLPGRGHVIGSAHAAFVLEEQSLHAIAELGVVLLLFLGGTLNSTCAACARRSVPARSWRPAPKSC